MTDYPSGLSTHLFSDGILMVERDLHESQFYTTQEQSELRQELMKDVIKELERLKGEKCISINIDDVIILIRGGTGIQDDAA